MGSGQINIEYSGTASSNNNNDHSEVDLRESLLNSFEIDLNDGDPSSQRSSLSSLKDTIRRRSSSTQLFVFNFFQKLCRIKKIVLSKKFCILIPDILRKKVVSFYRLCRL